MKAYAITTPEWLIILKDQITHRLSDEMKKQQLLDLIQKTPAQASFDKIKKSFLFFTIQSALEKFSHIEYPEVKTDLNTALSELEKEIPIYNQVISAVWVATMAAAKTRSKNSIFNWSVWESAGKRTGRLALLEKESSFPAIITAAAARAATIAETAEYEKSADRLIELFEEEVVKQ